MALQYRLRDAGGAHLGYNTASVCDLVYVATHRLDGELQCTSADFRGGFCVACGSPDLGFGTQQASQPGQLYRIRYQLRYDLNIRLCQELAKWTEKLGVGVLNHFESTIQVFTLFELKRARDDCHDPFDLPQNEILLV
jgi:hypothetical protein